MANAYVQPLSIQDTKVSVDDAIISVNAAVLDEEVQSLPQSNSQYESEEKYCDSDVGDYLADESKVREVNAVFDSGFRKVRESAKQASLHMLAGNKFMYAHLAKLTVWYHHVKGTKYLQELVKEKTQKEYHEKVNHGINFVPIIDIAWFGIERTDLPVNKTNRISRALNHLYKVYEEKFGYAPDAEDALIQYIVEMGGVSGLVTYGDINANPDDVSDLIEDKKIIAKAAALVKVGVEKSQKDSIEFFKSKTNLVGANFGKEIAVNQDKMALVLVKKDSENSYSVIDSIIGHDQVSSAASKSYLGQYNQLPPTIKFIVETVATQVCPIEQGVTFGQLLNEANKLTGADGKKSVRRLAYKHRDGTFLLSNIRSRTGAVTVAKPKLKILDGAVDDVFMTTSSRRMLETYLIGPKNFCLLNFAKDIGSGPIPQVNGTLYTHSTSIGVLTEITKNDYTQVPITFGRETLDQQPFDQVDVIDREDLKPLWGCTVSPAWFKNFNAAFTNNWVSSHARHVNRTHQSVLEMVFRKSSVEIKFFNIQNQAELISTVSTPSVGNGNGYRRSFLSKDFATAMLQLGELPLIGQATISAYPAYLRVSFETDVGNYSIYIPAVNSSGVHVEGGFGQYTLQSIVPEDDLIDAKFGDVGNDNDVEGEL